MYDKADKLGLNTPEGKVALAEANAAAAQLMESRFGRYYNWAATDGGAGISGPSLGTAGGAFNQSAISSLNGRQLTTQQMKERFEIKTRSGYSFRRCQIESRCKCGQVDVVGSCTGCKDTGTAAQRKAVATAAVMGDMAQGESFKFTVTGKDGKPTTQVWQNVNGTLTRCTTGKCLANANVATAAMTSALMASQGIGKTSTTEMMASVGKIFEFPVLGKDGKPVLGKDGKPTTQVLRVTEERF